MADGDILIDPRDRILLSLAARAPEPHPSSPRHRGRTVKLVGSAAVAAILSLSSPKLLAAPLGGVVASGSATISASGLVTTVNQSTDRAVIDWASFNLGTSETARFIVPSDSSATLNRITGGGVSTISGTVESNGVVYFSNPNGLVFDAWSRVSANGFVATTGTISNFDFMNRGEFAGFGSSSVTLNGVISAPAITALAGTVTVGGNLSAGSGKILLSSTNLTTIGLGAVISADGGAAGTGGKIIVWSDNHTDFLGNITALGGASTGDGGFVEVSGKQTLNFAGTVSTLAPHGKTGTLLLDPSEITISTGTNSTTNSSGTISSNSNTSIVNVTTLQTALASSNVIIDANAGTGTGSGLITVANDILAATSGTNRLTLTGAQIVINANVTMRAGGNLTLNATQASVWQDPGKVITANTISGRSVDGFSLGGENKISNLGAITNSGTAGILVKNNQALTINSVIIDGGTGGVMILAPNFDVTLGGAVTVKGRYLRLDMGNKNLKGGAQNIWADGLDVYYTSATSGNAATINVGSGTFTFVNDKRSVTTAKILNDSSTSSDWGTGLGTITSGTTVGGLTVITIMDASMINNQGVVYGGTVEIQGISTGAAKDLRYIEGTGVAVTPPSGLTAATGSSTFSGGLTLVGSGAGISIQSNGYNLTYGVAVTANLSTSNNGYGDNGDLTLVQINTSWGAGIRISSATVTASGMLTQNQLGALKYGGVTGTTGITISSAKLSAGGDINLTQSGSTQSKGFDINQSILITNFNLTLIQSGNTKSVGIQDEGSTFTANGNITIKQSGHAASIGINAGISTFTAGKNLSLIQSGSIVSANDGIRLSSGNEGLRLVSGRSNFVTIQTNNYSLHLSSYNNLVVKNGRVRIDLGTGAMNGSVGSCTLKADGLDVIFTGATSYYTATIEVGVGSFTFVNDKRSVTGAVTIDDSTTATTATNGWGAAPTYGGVANARILGGLTITGTNDSAIQGFGVVYGGAVTFQNISSGGAKDLRYIEGSSIALSGASTFAGGLVLRTTGAGNVSLANLTTAGDLSIYTHGGDLNFSNSATINLGTGSNALFNLGGIGGGVYNQGTYNLTLSNKTLTILAGSYNWTGGNINLGTGTFASVVGGGQNYSVTGTVLLGTGSGLAGLTYAQTITNSGGEITVRGVDPSAAQLGRITAASKWTSTTVPVTSTLTATGDIWIDGAANFAYTNITSTGGSINFINGASSFTGAITLSAKTYVSYSVPGSDLTLGGDWTVRGSFLRLDVGGSNMILGGNKINWSGGEVYYTGAAAGNSVTLALGKSNFIYVTDRRTTTTATVIDNSTTLPTAFTPGSGLTITTTGSKNGQGVVYGGTVEIQGISTGAAKDLRYIEGTGVGVSIPSTPAGLTAATGGSTFSGSLTLVSTGGGITLSSGDTPGVYINANLTTSNGGDLTLIQSGSATRFGILALDSTLTAGGAMSMIQSGSAGNAGIYARASTLTAYGDLSLLQTGTIADGYPGFYLYALGTGVYQGITLSAGGASSHWITLKTNNKNISLEGFDNFRLNQARVRIDLGTGTFDSVFNSLYAPGLDLYYTGGAINDYGGGANNNIDLATGRFIQVFDQGSSNLTINSATTLPAVTVNTNKIQAARGIWSGIRTSGTVTINGVRSDDPAARLAYIEGASVTLNGTASSFSTPLLLNATAGTITQSVKLSAPSLAVMATGAISLTGGFTAGSGALSYLDVMGQDDVSIRGDLTLGFMHLLNPTSSALNLGSDMSAAAATGLMIATYGHDLTLTSNVTVSDLASGTGMVRLDLSNRDGSVLGKLRGNGRSLTVGSAGNTADLFYSGGALSATTANLRLGQGDFVLVQRVSGLVTRESGGTTDYKLDGANLTFAANWASGTNNSVIAAKSKDLRGLATDGQLQVKGSVQTVTEAYLEADGIDLQPTDPGFVSFINGVVLVSTGTGLEKAATPSGTAIYGETPLQTFGIWAQSTFVQTNAPGAANGQVVMVQLGNVVGAESAYGICTLGTTKFYAQNNLFMVQMGDVISRSSVATDMAAGIHIDGLTAYMVGEKGFGIESYGAVMAKANAHLIMNTPQSTVSKTENLVLKAAGEVYLDKNAITGAFGIGVLTANSLLVERNDLQITVSSVFKKLGTEGRFAAFVHDLDSPEGEGNKKNGIRGQSLIGSQTESHGRSGTVTIDTSRSTGSAGSGYQDILVRNGGAILSAANPNILYVSGKTLSLNLGTSGTVAEGSQLRGGDQYRKADATFSGLVNLDMNVTYTGATAGTVPSPLTATNARLFVGKGSFTLTTQVDAAVTVSGAAITAGGNALTLLTGPLWSYGAFADGSTAATKAGVALISSGNITVGNIAANASNGAANLSILKGDQISLNGTINLNNSLLLSASDKIRLQGSLTLPDGGSLELDSRTDVELSGDLTLSAAQITFSRGRDFSAGGNRLTATAQNTTAYWSFGGNVTGGKGGTALELGSGKFLMMNYFAEDLTLDNTGSGSRIHLSSDLGDELVLNGNLNSGSLGRINASGAKGLGLVTTGTVTIDGVQGSTTAARLAYIEASGIGVVNSASSFAGALTLVSTGDGYAAVVGNTAGVLFNANLTTSNGGDLTVIQTGTSSGAGIKIDTASLNIGGNLNLSQTGRTTTIGIFAYSSTLTAGGDLTLNQSGVAGEEGIVINSTRLTAGGDLSILQTGTVSSGSDGIHLNASGAGATQVVAFAAGRRNFITLKANNTDLTLNFSDNFSFTRSKVRIDLGSGAMTSGGNYRLKADGLDLYYTGAASGNSATIAVGSGRFYRTVGKSGAYSLVAGELPTAAAPTGLTVTGSNPIGAAIVSDGLITVANITESLASPIALVGSGFVITGSNSFSGSNELSLFATSRTIGLGGSIALAANGNLRLETKDQNLTVTAAATVTVASGKGTIHFDLGTGTIGGAQKLTALGLDGIWLSGAAITNSQATVLDLGSGSFSVTQSSTENITLDNTATGNGIHTTAGVAISFFDPGTKVNATGGINLRLMTTGTVLINGVNSSNNSSKARLLTHIEGSGITVASSASSFSNGLKLLGHAGGITVSQSLTAGGDLNLTQDGTLTSGTVGITTTADLSSAKAISLNSGDNDIKLGGKLTSTALTLSTIAIAANKLTLTSAITSSNATVSVTLSAKTGVAYDNLNGAAATAAGFKWTTGGKNLTLTLDAANTAAAALAVGTGTVFSLGAGTLSSTVTGTGGFGVNSYFTNDVAITSNATLRTALTAAGATDANAEYHSLAELGSGVSATGFSGFSGDIGFSATATTVYSNPNTVVRFFRVTAGSLTRSLVAKSVSFIGSNSFSGKSFSGKVIINTSQANGDVTLTGALELSGADLTLALGSGKFLGSTYSLNTNGGNLAYSGATSGNSGEFFLGSGSFFLVKDNRATASAVNLSSLAAGDLPTALGWTTGATTVSGVTFYSAAGLTVAHDAAGSHTGIGVAYGGAVTVDGLSSSPASALNYVEGVGITLTGANRFDGPLTLNSQGQALTNSSTNLNTVGNLTLMTQGGNYYQTLAASFGGGGGGVISIYLGSGTYNDHANGQTANRYTLTASKSLLVVGGGSDIASSGTVIDLGSNWYGTGSGQINATTALTVSSTGVMDGATNLLSATSYGRLIPVARVVAATGYKLVTTGAVTISGVSSSNADVYGLSSISGSSITIDTSSSFGGDLSLITSNGAITQSSGANLTLAAGKSLTVTTTSGKINLGNVGNAIGRIGGLWSTGIGNGIVLASSVAMTVSGTVSSTGIITLTSGGALTLSKSGGLTIVSNGAIGITATSLVLGSAVTLSGGAVTMNLGTGAVTGAQSLTASGLDFQFSGATSGNAATIAVGSGSFTYVYDNRLTTTATTINNSSSFAASYGGTAGNRTIGGLTVTGSTDSAIQGLAAIYGGAVTIDGVSTGAAKNLAAIEGTSVTVSGAASSFAGGLVLRTTASGTISLGANLTTAGALRIVGGGLTLTSTVTTAGGAVTIELGATGVYTNGAGAGFSLDTSGRNLSLTAASISNTAATNAIFKLGSTGTLTLSGGLALATFTTSAGGTPTFSAGSIIDSTARYADFSAAGVKYYFVNSAADEATAKTALTTAGVSNFIVLRSSALTADDLGTRSIPAQTFTYSSTGLAVHATGEYFWQANGSTYASSSATTSPITLQDGHEVHFYGLTATSGTMPSTTPSWLSTSTGIVFDGVNSFSSGLTLASAGTISQATGPGNTLSVTGGNLVVTDSTAITLSNSGNALGSLGALSSSGAMAITTAAAMTLSGDINAVGAITLTATGVTIGQSITVSGGDLRLTAGTAAVTQAANKTLTLTGGNLNISSSSGITLTNSGNAIGSLGALNSSGAISITTGSNLSLTGALSAGGLIRLSSAALVIGDSIAVNGGDLSLNSTGTITQNPGKTLSIANDKKLIVTGSSAITLDGANAIWELGAITASGDIAILSGNDLTVGSSIISGGTITLESRGNLILSKSTNIGMTLTSSGDIKLVTYGSGAGSKIILESTIETVGGNVTIEAGVNGANFSGTYDQNGSSHRLYTNGKDLTLRADVVSFAAGSAVFDLRTPATPNDLTKTGTFYDSHTQVSPTTISLAAGASKIYFYTAAAGSGIAGADWHNISELSNLNYVMTSNMNRGEVFGKINYTGGSGLSAVTVNGPVAFYNISNGSLPSLEITVSGAIEFIGTNRFATGVALKSTGSITEASGATVQLDSGELALRSTGGEINFAQNNNRLRQIGVLSTTNGAITLWNNGDLALNGDLTATGAITIATDRLGGAGLVAAAASTNLSLLKAITTSGGAVTIGLGSGVFDGGGFAFSTSNQNLTIALGRYNLSPTGSSIDLGTGTITSTIQVKAATTLGSAAGQISSNGIFDAAKITASAAVLNLTTSAALTIADITVARPITITVPTGSSGAISFAAGESRFTDLTVSVANGSVLNQVTGSSVLISGRLIVTTNGGINLANPTNQISSLGKISGTASAAPPVTLTINLGNPDGGARLTDDISNSGGAIKIESAAALTIGKTGGLTIAAGNHGGIDLTVKDVTLSSNLNTTGGAVAFKGSRGKSYTDGGFILTTDHSDLSLEHSTLNLTAATSFSEGTGTAVATFSAKGIGVESTSNLVITGNSVQDSSGATIDGATTPLPVTKINFFKRLGSGFHTTGTVDLSGTITNDQLLNISADAGISVNGTVSTEGKDLTLLSIDGNIAITGSVTVGNLTLNSADTVLEVGQGEINAASITVVAKNGIDLSKSSNRIVSVKSLTTTRGDIRLNSTGDLAIAGLVTTNPGALLLRIDGKVTASVSLTGYNGVDIIATKLIWGDSNLSLGTAAPNGKTVKAPTYTLAYRSTQFGQSIDGHIWLSLSQPEGVDPTIRVTPVVIPEPPTPAPAAETPAPISVVPIAQAPAVEVEVFSGIPVFTPTTSFTQPTTNPGAQLFTVSASTTATARSEFKNHDIIYPNLKASMNTLLANGEFEEGSTEDYYIPLEGNSSLW